MTRLAMTAVLAAFLPFAGLAAAQGAPDDGILGKWYTEDDESIVEVYQAKSQDGKQRYYGKIIWLAEPLYEDDDPEAGKPKRNRESDVKEEQDDPILGLQVLKGFLYNADDGAWDSGTIYDPNNGKTYKCVIKYSKDPAVSGGEKLDVRGYIGVPALGRTTVWTRVPTDNDPSKTEG